MYVYMLSENGNFREKGSHKEKKVAKMLCPPPPSMKIKTAMKSKNSKNDPNKKKMLHKGPPYRVMEKHCNFI